MPLPLGVITGVLIALGTLGALPQRAGPKIAPTSGRSAYLDILERYRSGEHADAVRALNELREGHSASHVFGELERLADRAVGLSNQAAQSEFRQQRLAEGWAVAFPAAAAIHLEAGYFLLQLGQTERGGDHLEIARLLVDYPRFEQVMDVRPDVLKRHARLRRDIYYGILWTLQSERPLAPLEQHLLRMRRPFAADAELALAQGSLEEYWGSTLVVRTTKPPTMSMSAMAWRRSTQAMRLDNAEELFRLALKIDPRLAEARMRLGRVMHVRGKLREARAEFEAVLEQPGAPAPIRYLAALFLAEVLETEGNTAAAFARIRDLVLRFPECQSGHLAMSRAYEARGDRASALRALAPLWKEQVQRKCVDPWWAYNLGQVWRMPQLFDQLRAGAREAK